MKLLSVQSQSIISYDGDDDDDDDDDFDNGLFCYAVFSCTGTAVCFCGGGQASPQKQQPRVTSSCPHVISPPDRLKSFATQKVFRVLNWQAK